MYKIRDHEADISIIFFDFSLPESVIDSINAFRDIICKECKSTATSLEEISVKVNPNYFFTDVLNRFIYIYETSDAIPLEVLKFRIKDEFALMNISMSTLESPNHIPKAASLPKFIDSPDTIEIIIDL